MLKAGGYGHGILEVAKIFESCDVDFLGVANIGEARRLQDGGVKSEIYLLGATWFEEREEIVARRVVPCISNMEEAAHFSSIAVRMQLKTRVHLAVDTGMGRGGFLPETLLAATPKLLQLPGLIIEGIASHLSSADEDPEFTQVQIDNFEDLVHQLNPSFQFNWIHLSNSAGLLGYQSKVCNLIRPGLMLYGISPLPGHQGKLANVLTLKSRVTITRQVPPGHGISYGRTHITTRATRIATVGIGYGDGYPRHLSGKNASVLIHNQRFPIIGRVTMDQIIIALGDDTQVKAGDEVILFGKDLPIHEVSEPAETIPWEVLTGITPRVQRVYL